MTALVETPAKLDADWERRAACRNAPPHLFLPFENEQEPTHVPPEADRYCSVCPVRQECLNKAMDLTDFDDKPIEASGIWGGTTQYQRRQLRRKQPRQSCPGCKAGDSLVTETNTQLCLACGRAWYVF